MTSTSLRIRWLFEVVLNSTHRVVLNSTHKAPCECQTALTTSSAKQHSLYRIFLPSEANTSGGRCRLGGGAAGRAASALAKRASKAAMFARYKKRFVSVMDD